MTTAESKPGRRFVDTDAGDLARQPDADVTVVQVALLGLLTILLLTFTAWITYSSNG